MREWIRAVDQHFGFGRRHSNRAVSKRNDVEELAKKGLETRRRHLKERRASAKQVTIKATRFKDFTQTQFEAKLGTNNHLEAALEAI